MTTPTLTAIPVATITGTDGNTITLELRPEVSLDHGLRYGIYNAETGEGTETSGRWYGAETYSDDDGALHLTGAHAEQAQESALRAIAQTWGQGWNLTSLN